MISRIFSNCCTLSCSAKTWLGLGFGFGWGIGSVVRVKVGVWFGFGFGLGLGLRLGLDVLGEDHLLARLGHDRLE